MSVEDENIGSSVRLGIVMAEEGEAHKWLGNISKQNVLEAEQPQPVFMATINLTSQDPIERLNQFIEQASTYREKLRLDKVLLPFENGTLCQASLTLTSTEGYFGITTVLAQRAYFVDKAVWGDVDPKKVVYSLILDELGLAPPPPVSAPEETPSFDHEEAEKTRDMAAGLLQNLTNPEYRPSEETVFSLLRQVGKLSFSALRSLTPPTVAKIE